MTRSGRELVDWIGLLMASGDVDALVELYATDAKLVRYLDVTTGHDAIRQAIAASLAAHGTYIVYSIDQFRDAGDLVMWDATVQTDAGMLLTTQIIVLDASGLISHHIPRIQGYWGM